MAFSLMKIINVLAVPTVALIVMVQMSAIGVMMTFGMMDKIVNTVEMAAYIVNKMKCVSGVMKVTSMILLNQELLYARPVVLTANTVTAMKIATNAIQDIQKSLEDVVSAHQAATNVMWMDA